MTGSTGGVTPARPARTARGISTTLIPAVPLLWLTLPALMACSSAGTCRIINPVVSSARSTSCVNTARGSVCGMLRVGGAGLMLRMKVS